MTQDTDLGWPQQGAQQLPMHEKVPVTG